MPHVGTLLRVGRNKKYDLMKTQALRKILLAVLLSAMTGYCMSAQAQPRTDTMINDGWTISPISDTNKKAKRTPVTLPHTWNAAYDDGRRHYNRETMVYRRVLDVTPDMRGKRLFLYFEGVNSVADVYLNRRTVGNHKGGYTAFCIEITDKVRPGGNNLEVWAGNALRTDVLPISGDFNVYGGIHRPVRLIVTGKDCISPLFYGSPGVLIRQDKVTSERADITVTTKLSLKSGASGLVLRTSVTDADGRTVAAAETPAAGESVDQRLTVNKPTLWQGRDNPYLYKVKVELTSGTDVLDCVEQTTGLRSFSVDPDKGFFLNGRHYDLHGFNRHDDFKGCGSALRSEQYAADMDLVMESGATMLRLAHYPHGETIYRLADERGIVLWSEIALCGPGGYDYTGYMPNVEDNARQTLREMVYQKMNHPSVCFWGLFNELLAGDEQPLRQYDNPVPFVKELNGLCRQLDPTRLTTFATCVDQKYYLGCADLIAWNKYFGWRTAEKEAAAFFDNARATAGGSPVGVSEYGRGGSIAQHADPLYAGAYAFPGGYHPEEYQAVCHEGYWLAFKDRPWLWLKTVWQFSDTQSSIKDEGDTPGVNDKGMVTYDRKIRKDAFFFYKANWNPEPMLHLCSKRFAVRDSAVTDIKAYTNLREAVLYVNGRKIGKARPDGVKRAVWRGVELSPGENTVRVTARSGKTVLEDTCVWRVDGK